MESNSLNEIRVDVSSIPEYARRSLAEGAIALVQEQMEDPEYESKFRAWKEKRESGQPAR